MRKKIEILCVDDEPRVLQGLTDLLGTKFIVHSAESGHQGLALLQKNDGITVVLSDMRMPEMNGAAFLEKVRVVAPNATRMLLTGYSDMESAIAAVNRGQIFRFLTKPCAPDDLFLAFEAAIEQNRLVTAEKVLLQKTLLGSLKALMQVLALTNPLAFGRALRLKKLVRAIAAELPEQPVWHWEVAALMCQVGCMNLPEATLMKLNIGDPLESDEQLEYDEAIRGSIALVENIPRLEPVIEILMHIRKQSKPSVKSKEPNGARALRVVLDYDALEARGWLPTDIITALRLQAHLYDITYVDALERATVHAGTADDHVQNMPVERLAEGMVVVEDVCRRNGILVLPRGITLSQSVIEHLRRSASDILTIKVRVEPQLSAA